MKNDCKIQECAEHYTKGTFCKLLRAVAIPTNCIPLSETENQLNCTFQKAFRVEILPLEIEGMTKFAQETDLCMQRKMICLFNKNQWLIEPYFIICETSFTGFSIQNLLSRLFEGDDMVLGKQDQKVWLEMTTNITDSQTTRDKLFLKYTKVVRLNK